MKKKITLILILTLIFNLINPSIIFANSKNDRTVKESDINKNIIVNEETKEIINELFYFNKNNNNKKIAESSVIDSEYNIFDNLTLKEYVEEVYGTSIFQPYYMRYASSKIAPIVNALGIGNWLSPYLNDNVLQDNFYQSYRLTNHAGLGSLISNSVREMLKSSDNEVALSDYDKNYFAILATVTNNFSPYIHNKPDIGNYEFKITDYNEYQKSLSFRPTTEERSILSYDDGSIKDYPIGSNEKHPLKVGYLTGIDLVESASVDNWINMSVTVTRYNDNAGEWLPNRTSYLNGIEYEGSLEEFYESFDGDIDLLEFISKKTNNQFGFVESMKEDEIQSVATDIKDRMNFEFPEIAKKIPDTMSLNFYKLGAQIKGRDLVIDGSGKFLDRETGEEVPISDINLGYIENPIYSYRKIETFLGLYDKYYILEDGILDEERTDLLPYHLSDEEFELFEKFGGKLIENLPKYDDFLFEITSGTEKMIFEEVLTFGLMTGVTKAATLFSAISRGDDIRDFSRIEVATDEMAEVVSRKIQYDRKAHGTYPSADVLDQVTTTQNYHQNAIRHLGGEYKYIKDSSKIKIAGAHSRHSSVIGENSDLIIKPTGNTYKSEDYPFFSEVNSHKFDVETKPSTIFPDSWDAEKIVNTSQDIIDNTHKLTKAEVEALGIGFKADSNYYTKVFYANIDGRNEPFNVLVCTKAKTNNVKSVYPVLPDKKVVDIFD